MGTNTFSHNYLQNKSKKEATEIIETLESVKIVRNETKANKIRNRIMKRGFKRTKTKKLELAAIELNRKLDILKDSKHEVQNRIDIKSYEIFNKKFG